MTGLAGGVTRRQTPFYNIVQIINERSQPSLRVISLSNPPPVKLIFKHQVIISKTLHRFFIQVMLNKGKDMQTQMKKLEDNKSSDAIQAEADMGTSTTKPNIRGVTLQMHQRQGGGGYKLNNKLLVGVSSPGLSNIHPLDTSLKNPSGTLNGNRTHSASTSPKMLMRTATPSAKHHLSTGYMVRLPRDEESIIQPMHQSKQPIDMTSTVAVQQNKKIDNATGLLGASAKRRTTRQTTAIKQKNHEQVTLNENKTKTSQLMTIGTIIQKDLKGEIGADLYIPVFAGLTASIGVRGNYNMNSGLDIQAGTSTEGRPSTSASLLGRWEGDGAISLIAGLTVGVPGGTSAGLAADVTGKVHLKAEAKTTSTLNGTGGELEGELNIDGDATCQAGLEIYAEIVGYRYTHRLYTTEQKKLATVKGRGKWKYTTSGLEVTTIPHLTFDYLGATPLTTADVDNMNQMHATAT